MAKGIKILTAEITSVSYNSVKFIEKHADSGEITVVKSLYNIGHWTNVLKLFVPVIY